MNFAKGFWITIGVITALMLMIFICTNCTALMVL